PRRKGAWRCARTLPDGPLVACGGLGRFGRLRARRTPRCGPAWRQPCCALLDGASYHSGVGGELAANRDFSLRLVAADSKAEAARTACRGACGGQFVQL